MPGRALGGWRRTSLRIADHFRASPQVVPLTRRCDCMLSCRAGCPGGLCGFCTPWVRCWGGPGRLVSPSTAAGGARTQTPAGVTVNGRVGGEAGRLVSDCLRLWLRAGRSRWRPGSLGWRRAADLPGSDRAAGPDAAPGQLRGVGAGAPPALRHLQRSITVLAIFRRGTGRLRENGRLRELGDGARWPHQCRH